MNLNLVVTSFMIMVSLMIFSCKEESSTVDPNRGKPSVSITYPFNNSTLVDSTGITVVATDDKRVVRVELYIDGSSSPNLVSAISPYRFAWQFGNVPDSSTHTFVAKAIDNDSNRTSSTVVSVLVRRFAPSNLRLSYMDHQTVVLQWEDNSRNENLFEIQMSQDGAGYTIIDTVDANTTAVNIHRSYQLNVMYYFRVRAVADTSISIFSNVISGSISLYSPGDLNITALSDTSVTLTWEDQNDVETGFEIEGSETGTSYTLVTTAPANTTTIALSNNYDHGKRYFFRMRTRSLDVVSDYSNNVLMVYTPSMYVGGDFSSVAGIHTSSLAEWTGSYWKSVGSGLEGAVYTIAGYKNELYAGGTITNAGSVSVSNIARWNGMSWLPVGSGINGKVTALAVYHDDLYAGGNFTQAGGIAVNNVARWDGTSWSSVGYGFNDAVHVLSVKNNILYAGGKFTASGADTIKRIAQFNGTAWVAVGKGVDNEVLAAGSYYGSLLIGGMFNYADTMRVNKIAYWDGSMFNAVGSGFNNTVSASASLATSYNYYLYAGGSFTSSGSYPTYKVASFQNNDWQAVGNGLSGDVSALYFYQNLLYAGENISSSKTLATNRIMQLSPPQTWSVFASGVDGKIRTINSYSSWHWEKY